ncbi:MAG: UDP-3-O-(3-hydroxymyristoyl)glucosamine N-acyltransferase [Pseudomonadota bacterium]
MPFTLAEIAAALGADVLGDGSLRIHGAAEPGQAGPSDLALAMNPSYASALSEGAARAALVWDGADWRALGLEGAVAAPRGRLAMATVTEMIDTGPDLVPGLHPMAAIDPSAEIGSGASIGPFVSIGPGTKIGNNARIASHVSIGANAVIGADALIYAGARIADRVRIGDRFIAQPNCVLGGDGFSFVTPEKSNVEQARETLGAHVDHTDQRWVRIHSLGGVEVGDDVEIGAGSAVDRGTIRATVIGDRTKLDNLVHIAHNCVIGVDCLICGQVGLAGSARIGNRVVLGGQVGVSDNIFVGDDVVAGGGSGILTNVPAGRVVLGYPAIKMDQQIEASKNIRRLPRIYRDVAELKKAVSKRDASD